MAYSNLNVAEPDRSRNEQCALVVMAKAPRPGTVKTRLAPPLTLEQASVLSICFLKDTAENIAQVAASGIAAGLVSYTPVGDEEFFDGILPTSFALVPQRGNDFGARLLGAAEDLLSCGFGAVCLIDSDSPTVPAAAFEQAIAELARDGNRIVLGPSNDGGYYLIGLRRAHPELFANIRWSTSTVYAETLAAAAAAGIEVVELPLWYDVDDGAALELLSSELLAGIAPAFAKVPGYPAPHSREFLRELRVAETAR
jgi:rSAM/selenodomain-associated transferase 1